jgi:uncharacterized protein with LGFP repeats
MMATLWTDNPLEDIWAAQIGNERFVEFTNGTNVWKNINTITWEIPPHIDELWIGITTLEGRMFMATKMKTNIPPGYPLTTTITLEPLSLVITANEPHPNGLSSLSS